MNPIKPFDMAAIYPFSQREPTISKRRYMKMEFMPTIVKNSKFLR
jgi:hypothetical protein